MSRRPLSPSAAAAKDGLVVVGDGCGGTLSMPSFPAASWPAAARTSGGGGGSSRLASTPKPLATSSVLMVDDDSASKQPQVAKLRYRTRSIVVALVVVVTGIAVSFLAWRLTIGQGPPPPVVPFHRCNATTTSNDDATTALCCNGLSEICDLPVNEVLFATAHNAHSTRQDFFLRPNHRYRIDEALESGYRAFLLDVCSCPPIGLVFCHGICGSGTVSMDQVFAIINSFLVRNPNEVIIVEFQMHRTEVEWLFMLQDVIYEAGLGDVVHVHRGTFYDDWATMRQLIETSERLILFHHNGECYNYLFHTCYAVLAHRAFFPMPLLSFSNESNSLPQAHTAGLDRCVPTCCTPSIGTQSRLPIL